MFTTNPFSILAETVPPIALQSFVIVMVALVIIGTLVDIIHKKNVKYFFENAKKAKLSATKTLSAGEKISVISKTIVSDIATTSELGAGKRRAAHLLGMYGTILFWTGSVIMIFCYSSPSSDTPSYWPIIWHVGAIMTVVGGSWFWFFLRVDVYSEAHPWYRIIKADLFVLALIASSLFGLIWSCLQSLNLNDRWDDKAFLVLYIISNLALFGGVYWSKFAHMFYKPGASIQKNLAEADGSRDNLPPPADVPEQYGLGIDREKAIGPNILLHNTTYIIKEPQSPAFVSWHQDLTYWGFSDDDQISVWLALSTADDVSGAMYMIPGSHLEGKKEHKTVKDENNVLFQSQWAQNVDESKKTLCVLKPGEASFHHGWTIHSSMPNKSDERRIGFNIQYVAAHIKQMKNNTDTAICVRGVDNYNNFGIDIPAVSDELNPATIAKQKEMQEKYKSIVSSRN